MLTAEQMRAARALVRMEQGELATRAGVSLGTIKRLEGLTGTLNAQESTLAAIKSALERAGVTFFDAGDDAPKGGAGVRMTDDGKAAEWNANVSKILDALIESLEMAIEDRGLRGEAITEAIVEARQETYDLLEWGPEDTNTPDMFEEMYAADYRSLFPAAEEPERPARLPGESRNDYIARRARIEGKGAPVAGGVRRLKRSIEAEKGKPPRSS